MIVTPARKRFTEYVARLLRVSFTDAEAVDMSSRIEGTALFISTETQPNLSSRDVTVALMEAKRAADSLDDTRPVMVVTKENNREPLVHLTLDSFLSLVERCFWAPIEDEDVIPITRNKR